MASANWLQRFGAVLNQLMSRFKSLTVLAPSGPRPATPSEMLKVKGNGGVPYSLAFSPDGRRLALASEDYANGRKAGTVQVWDAATGQEMLTLKVDTYRATSVAFSPDGKWLASVGGYGSVKLWDAATGQEVRKLRG